MEKFLAEDQSAEPGINKGLLLALAAGIIIVGAIVGFFMLQPSNKQIAEDTMQGAYREGSPEFAELTKKIVAQTDANRTTQSPTGMGTIVMNVGGKISNLTGKTLTALEIKVTVIDSFGNPVKDKTVAVVPKQAERMTPGQVLPVQILMEGFNRDDDRAQIRWKVTAIKAE